MKKTITRGDITLTLPLNSDESVDLRGKMIIDYPGIEDSLRIAPTVAGRIGIGTIQDQFDYIATFREFDAAHHRRAIGERIKKLREEAGLTQDQLAEKTSMLKQNISRIEQGKYSTGQDILSKIADALGKKLDII
ncbi:helix-turn-helix domain-containing protein [Chitinophaga sp. sic0106]|uniref:helix-turn-helix domain-containing protein n=1 Tax=Chitinophaga sp. sic0106 TaxID=2854785 RepID=UPI001C43B2AA|nr:helix-turn-helix transcriptional regulator [Chitinophaga sp. sic0106]MBV7531357.1 helix-turn-helix transcriptional regulator [Chitinophaga sp. sic0106]